MNSTMFLHNRFHHASASMERHAPVFDETCALKRKALERWENEGGRIPELAARTGNSHHASGDAGAVF